MPPKKAGSEGSNAKQTAEAKSPAPAQPSDSKGTLPTKPTKTSTEEPTSHNGDSKKRKATSSTAEPNKAPRRSARGASNNVDPVKLLQYLLSPASLDLCRPKDEKEDLENHGADIRTYSSSTFTPFEELICATILSRPIGHMLGLRSIRTIFNAPYELTTPKKIREAGNEGCREALDKARTQHRQKTAEELVLLADAAVEHLGSGEDDVSLERVREECGHDAGKEREMLKKHVKGLGKTGLDIFGRRIQGVWSKFYPFVDGKTSGALEKLGLPSTADAFRDLLDEHWKELKVDDIETQDAEEKKRKAFVRILERVLGADLEGKIDVLKSQAT